MSYIVSYNYENGMSRMLSVAKKERKMGFHHDSCDMCIFKWGKVTYSTELICVMKLLEYVFNVWGLTEHESKQSYQLNHPKPSQAKTNAQAHMLIFYPDRGCQATARHRDREKSVKDKDHDRGIKATGTGHDRGRPDT
ncbi:hypothetical protein Lal_00006863 [Lupinus albus]|nr:hypothetical protein Lal_00006863 [Lupinus albus]